MNLDKKIIGVRIKKACRGFELMAIKIKNYEIYDLLMEGKAHDIKINELKRRVEVLS